MAARRAVGIRREWTRMVAAHERCNQYKSHHLAAPEHLRKWCDRFPADRRDDLLQLGAESTVPADRDTTLAIGRSNYLPLPDGAPLWVEGTSEFVPA